MFISIHYNIIGVEYCNNCYNRPRLKFYNRPRLKSSRLVCHTFIFYCHALFEGLCYNCQHINVSYWQCTYSNSTSVHQQLKTCFTRQFYFRDEKVILLDRNLLRAIIVLIFAHDMQIQVAHALCKQGCRCDKLYG